MSRNCTSTADRQCRICSPCLSGQYSAEACSLYHDTSCAGKCTSYFIYLLSFPFFLLLTHTIFHFEQLAPTVATGTTSSLLARLQPTPSAPPASPAGRCSTQCDAASSAATYCATLVRSVPSSSPPRSRPARPTRCIGPGRRPTAAWGPRGRKWSARTWTARSCCRLPSTVGTTGHSLDPPALASTLLTTRPLSSPGRSKSDRFVINLFEYDAKHHSA